jgi:predicted NBD/HSP70 family sugar kinase
MAFCGRLAQAIANVVLMFNPDAVVIGGPLARHPQLIEGRLRELLPFVLPEEQLVRTEVVVCPAANSDEAFGAATVVLHHIFSPLQVDVEDVL